MSFLTLMFIATGLAMDAFAVAIAASFVLGGVSRRQVFRLAFHFGLFQALMPVIGWAAGSKLDTVIATWDHWAAFALLTGIGAKAIYEAWSASPEERSNIDPTRGLRLVTLSVATSLDALAVGVSLGLLRVDIWYPSVVIGVVAAAWTCLGMRIGHRLGERFGQRIEIVGGLILIAIGAKILWQHM